MNAKTDAWIERIIAKQNMTREQAIELIESIDKGRDNYVKRFTNLSRYDMRNYDLILDMDYLSEDEAVEKILSFIGR